MSSYPSLSGGTLLPPDELAEDATAELQPAIAVL